jgi:spermidine/putrescine transport system ATP-binding protein
MKRVPRRERERRVREVLAMVRLESLARRSVKQLSGGEQQRVALARALVNHPSVLLLDEPLGSLDLKLRREMQLELKAIQERVGITFVHVTHDQDEAMALADRIAVLHRGRLLQVGTAEEVYERPATKFVASFIGSINMFEGTVAVTQDGSVEVAAPGLGRFLAASSLVPEGVAVRRDDPIAVAVRPEHVELTMEPDVLRAEYELPVNAYRGVVRRVVYGGSERRYEIVLSAGASIEAKAAGSALIEYGSIVEGTPVTVTWPSQATKVLTG